MIVVGVTGNMGSGKTTVSRMLRDMGAEVVDADQLAREIVQPHRPAWRELVAEFGSSILREDGTIDRRRLARMVFADAERLRRLNEITHPRIIEEIDARIRAARRRGDTRVLVIDAPLIIEAGMVSMVDRIWLVRADQEVRMQRLLQRGEYTRSEIRDRLRAQMPENEQLRYADAVIDNSGCIEETRRQVRALWEELCKEIERKDGPDA